MFTIPQLIILAACIYYLTKKVTIDGILLILGSVIGLLSTVFNVFIIPRLIQNNLIDTINGRISIMTLAGIISSLAYLAYSIGFFILIYNTVQEKKIQ